MRALAAFVLGSALVLTCAHAGIAARTSTQGLTPSTPAPQHPPAASGDLAADLDEIFADPVIARALVGFNEELRSGLRKAGLLTRDPRAKEWKKYGMAGARKRFQFSKR